MNLINVVSDVGGQPVVSVCAGHEWLVDSDGTLRIIGDDSRETARFLPGNWLGVAISPGEKARQ